MQFGFDFKQTESSIPKPQNLNKRQQFPVKYKQFSLKIRKTTLNFVSKQRQIQSNIEVTLKFIQMILFYSILVIKLMICNKECIYRLTHNVLTLKILVISVTPFMLFLIHPGSYIKQFNRRLKPVRIAKKMKSNCVYSLTSLHLNCFAEIPSLKYNIELVTRSMHGSNIERQNAELPIGRVFNKFIRKEQSGFYQKVGKESSFANLCSQLTDLGVQINSGILQSVNLKIQESKFQLLFIILTQVNILRKAMFPMPYYHYPFSPYCPYPYYESVSPENQFPCPNPPQTQSLRSPFAQNIVNLLKQENDHPFSASTSVSDNKSHHQYSNIRNKSAEKQKQVIIDQKIIKVKSVQNKNKNQSQIAGRNANSNLLRMFFRQLDHRLEKQSSIVNKIIKKNKMKTTSVDFMEWFEINRVQHKNYIRLPNIKVLFINKKKNDENTKIIRILFKEFLQRDAHCFYLTSKKIKKSMMNYNYQSTRTVLNQICRSH